ALEERALARAVGPDQAAQLALAKREVHLVDGDHAAEAHRELVRLDDAAHEASPDVPPSRRLAPAAFALLRRARARQPSARCSVGRTPRGNASTTTIRIAPSTSELSISVCWPSSSLTMPSAIAPRIGPISVPSPPTMTQISTSAACPRLNSPGVTISAQFANRQPASPAIPALIVKTAVLYSGTS